MVAGSPSTAGTNSVVPPPRARVGVLHAHDSGSCEVSLAQGTESAVAASVQAGPNSSAAKSTVRYRSPKPACYAVSVQAFGVVPWFMLLGAGCEAGVADSADSAPSPREWQDVAANLPGALLSVWGRSADDVYVVGADPGGGPMAFHLANGEWTPLAGLDAGHLWWVSGDAANVWIAGEGGRIFRIPVEGGEPDAWVLDVRTTLFGIWGPGDGTAFAVGGNPDLPSDAAKLFAFDGAEWTEVRLPANVAAEPALFKVWGRTANDVWAVGSGGVSLHYDGTIWTFVDTASTANLITVHDGYIAGGTVNGTILSLSTTGMVWSDESPAGAVQLAGVHGGVAPVAVGVRGSVWFRDSDGWTMDTRELPTYQDLHAVWVDPEGGVWAAGGHVSGEPLIQGALVYDGSRDVAVLQ